MSTIYLDFTSLKWSFFSAAFDLMRSCQLSWMRLIKVVAFWDHILPIDLYFARAPARALFGNFDSNADYGTNRIRMKRRFEWWSCRILVKFDYFDYFDLFFEILDLWSRISSCWALSRPVFDRDYL